MDLRLLARVSSVLHRPVSWAAARYQVLPQTKGGKSKQHFLPMVCLRRARECPRPDLRMRAPDVERRSNDSADARARAETPSRQAPAAGAPAPQRPDAAAERSEQLNLRENRADMYPGIDTRFGGRVGARAYAR